MGKEYKIINKGVAIGYLRFYGRDRKKRLARGEEYYLGELSDREIKYYRQLYRIGLHLVEVEQEDEVETEDNIDNNDEEEDEVLEVDEEKVENFEEEIEEDELNIKELSVEDIVNKVEDGEIELDEDILSVLKEDKLRDLGERYEVGNYWNKKEENIIEDILEIVNS